MALQHEVLHFAKTLGTNADGIRCLQASRAIVQMNRDLVGIGTSAGGVRALLFLVRHLPADLPATILVTIHLPQQSVSSLDELLSNSGPLKAAFAADGDPLERSRIVIAPPGRHLLVDGDRLALGNGPRENHARPAIDPMFRSMGLCCGPRAVGVVLTGTLDDGASGLSALRSCGGLTIVQDPDDADFSEMPFNALARLTPDHLTPLAGLPSLLCDLVRQPAGPWVPVPTGLRYEVEVARTGQAGISEMDRLGQRSTLTCPDCGGLMWELDEKDVLRYRCHVGHAYTAGMMRLGLEASLRHALGSALRALDEQVALTEKLRHEAAERGHQRVSAHWAQRKAETEREAGIIRAAIERADEIAPEAA